MGFSLPHRVAESTEKIRISVPLSVHSWASGLAETSGITVEEVLQEAVAYAYRSAQKSKPKKPAKRPQPALENLVEN